MRRRIELLLLASCMCVLAITPLVGAPYLFAGAALVAPTLVLRVARPDRPLLGLELGLPIVLFGALTLATAGNPGELLGLPLSTACLLLGLWLATWIWSSWRFAKDGA